MNVDITELILIPMLLHLGAVLLCWIIYACRDEPRPARAQRHRIYRCQHCEHVYLDARNVPVARCSRCGKLNEAVRM